jgi:8-oxo-dGTP pyrophosphatase MutT (NUDIX family)
LSDISTYHYSVFGPAVQTPVAGDLPIVWKDPFSAILGRTLNRALWRSGYAEVCKTFYAGSIPVGASIFIMKSKELAGCVIADSEGRIILIHRNTPSLTHWELPGGKCEPNESKEAAAVREVAEEIRVAVRIKKELGRTAFEDGGTHWRYTWFLAEIIDGEPSIGEPDRYDGIRHFAITDPDLDRQSVSINIRNLIEQIESGQVEWPPSYV